MKRISSKLTSLLFLPAVAVLIGCAPLRGPHSDYQGFYQSRLVSIRVPTFAEIAAPKDALPVSLHQPMQQAWEACLQLATQSRGILGVAEDGGGGHRLLLISGENLEYKRDRWVFVDRWLAVSLRPLAEDLTEVRVAFVSPKTARVAPFVGDRFPVGFKGDSQRSVSLSAREAFILALQKTFAEDKYLGRLGGSSRPAARGVPREIDVRPLAKRESVALQLGNFNSATLRRSEFVLNVPRLEERVAEVAYDIAAAARQLDKKPKIFIVADFMRDAHIDYNGDLFITTGLLDRIKSVDELAGILSHELSHIYLHHGPLRGGGLKRAGRISHSMASMVMLGCTLVGGLIPTSEPQSAAPKDSLLTNKGVLVGAAVGLGALYLGGQVGTSVGKDIGNFTIYRFTRKEELAADDYGAELLWAAGYDYRGLLNFLKREGDGKLFEKKGRSAH